MNSEARIEEISERVSMEFTSPEALNRYMKDHPGANKSDHTVKKPSTDPWKRMNEPGGGQDHPFNQMRQRKHDEKMKEIAKHVKKDVKDVTNDDIVKFNERGKKSSERIDGIAGKIAKGVMAGGTLFFIKKAPFKYKGYVERMMPRWFEDSGEYSGEFVKGSVDWDSMPKVNPQLLSVSHRFTFQQTGSDGWIEEEGKVEARIDGAEISIRVMLYS